MRFKIDEKGEKHTEDDVKHQVMSCFFHEKEKTFSHNFRQSVREDHMVTSHVSQTDEKY